MCGTVAAPIAQLTLLLFSLTWSAGFASSSRQPYPVRPAAWTQQQQSSCLRLVRSGVEWSGTACCPIALGWGAVALAQADRCADTAATSCDWHDAVAGARAAGAFSHCTAVDQCSQQQQWVTMPVLVLCPDRFSVCCRARSRRRLWLLQQVSRAAPQLAACVSIHIAASRASQRTAGWSQPDGLCPFA